MRKRSCVKHDRDRPAAPERDVIGHALFHRGDRNVAKRMIGKMADEICEQDEPSEKAHLANSDSALEAEEKCREGSFGHGSIRPCNL